MDFDANQLCDTLYNHLQIILNLCFSIYLFFCQVNLLYHTHHIQTSMIIIKLDPPNQLYTLHSHTFYV